MEIRFEWAYDDSLPRKDGPFGSSASVAIDLRFVEEEVDVLLTVKGAADRLAISPSLIYSLVAGRKLRFVRIGNGRGRIRIPEDAVDEYLARSTFLPREKQAPSGPVRLRHLRLRRPS